MSLFLLLLIIPNIHSFTTQNMPRVRNIKPMVKMTINENNVNQILDRRNLFEENSYNSLLKKIDNKEISNIYFTNSLDTVIAEKTNTKGNTIDNYAITKINPYITNNIIEKSVERNVNTIFLQQPTPSAFYTVSQGVFGFIGNFLLPILFITFIMNIIRGQQIGSGGLPGMPNLTTSKSVNIDKANLLQANITLNSFAGSPEIFEECTEVVSYLKNDTIYKAAGAEIPRGILLEGPPGTGKTLLAKAIASDADANFISIAASEFVELFIGMGAAKVRSFFKTARDNKPCILFIDEIDAVGKQRGGGISMGNDEREQTLNQILAEMDGFANNEGILIIAATNRKDVLDAALLRPGRFDRIITVPLPDRESRKAIFKIHSKNKELSPEINFELVAELTNGFSGAQIKNLLNEAAIYTSRRGETVIQETDLINAVEKLIVGLPKRIDTRSDEAKCRVAIHEAGHALLTALYEEYFELKKVTIQSTYNGAGGYTLFNEYANVTESGLYTKDLLMKRLVIGMGGKAAETIFYGEDYVSVGAIQDLKTTNSLAQRMIGNYGMGNKLIVFFNENMDNDRNIFSGKDTYSDNTKELFDKESLSLVNEAYDTALFLLIENKLTMNILVEALLEKKTLYGADVSKLMNKN